jgi:hypothetical protein
MAATAGSLFLSVGVRMKEKLLVLSESLLLSLLASWPLDPVIMDG